MSGSTISGTVTSTVQLDYSPPATVSSNPFSNPVPFSVTSSPLTITSTGLVTVANGYGISAGGAGSVVSTPLVVNGLTVIAEPTLFLPGTIDNYGTVSAAANEGIYLRAGGLVVNQGAIYGADGGIYSAGAGQLQYTPMLVGGQTLINKSTIFLPVTIENEGTITGGAGVNAAQPDFINAGIVLNTGAVTNARQAVISGVDFGVAAISGSVMVSNDGIIQASAVAGSGITDVQGVTIEDGIGVAFLAGGTLVNTGTIAGDTDAVYFTGGNALLVVQAGAVFAGGVSADSAFGNEIELTSGAVAGVLNLGTSFSGFETIQIDGGALWTIEGSTIALGGDTISGFAAGDTIVLTDFTATSAQYNAGVLSLSNGDGGFEYITLAGEPIALAGSDFTLSTGHGIAGTEITLCFYEGTHIATQGGEVAVQYLCVGDMVLTAGGPLPVRWLGRSEVSLRFADRLASLPIRIKAGALGDNLPRRDLLLSPDHALFLGGVLVHASALVDGVSILREYDVPEVFTYYHIELASHELLFAEGALVESFVDNVERRHFQNWNERDAPDLPIVEMQYPRVKAARQLPKALRARVGKLA